MKRCPECNETYEDSEKFCELDGQHLISGIPASRAARTQSNESSQQREIWFVGTAGVVLGIVVCVGGYLAYGLWNEDSGFKEANTPALTTQAQVPVQTSAPPAPRPQPTTAPEGEATTVEPEPSPETSPAASTEASETIAAKLNQGPVSTGQRKKDAGDGAVQTIIQMNDGTAVEVDAAWEDGQGVWYRRGGMVAFVESQRVKAITGRAAQKTNSVSQ